jgi:hypothetical protein
VRAAAKQRVEKLLEDAQIKLCAKRSQQASADIAEREAKIEAEIAPLARVVDRLDEICGVGQTAAQLIIAEIGVDMGRFPPAHLASWPLIIVWPCWPTLPLASTIWRWLLDPRVNAERTKRNHPREQGQVARQGHP